MKEWNGALKEAFNRHRTSANRDVGFPGNGRPGDFSVKGTPGGIATILLQDHAQRNMQSDGAAFEVWALALHGWCGAPWVRLIWNQPVAVQRQPGDAWHQSDLHYQRFLYRVRNFQELFPGWFEVGMSDAQRQSRSGPGVPLYLNAPAKRDDTAFNLSSGPENRLEHWALNSADFVKRYPRMEHRYRQLPVGVFSDVKPSKVNAVFTGGKAAIDLVGFGGKHVWLFELKAEKNMPAGTLSELLFYAAVVRDVRLGKITAPDSPPYDKVREATHIHAVMFGHALHPLLEPDGKLLQLLNDAVAGSWNKQGGAPTLTFEAVADPTARA